MYICVSSDILENIREDGYSDFDGVEEVKFILENNSFYSKIKIMNREYIFFISIYPNENVKEICGQDEICPLLDIIDSRTLGVVGYLENKDLINIIKDIPKHIGE